MRKITQKAVEAFYNGEDFKLGNTRVSTDSGEVVLSLHGNDIAKRTEDGTFISNAGWFSNTAKERLNGLLGVSIHQENFTWYLNGEVWDGSWIKIE